MYKLAILLFALIKLTQPNNSANDFDYLQCECEISSVEYNYTEEEITVLAKMLWGEARGAGSTTEKAACVWTVLNRCDTYGQGIIEVVKAPSQFVGYRANNPVDAELYALSEDVVRRWYDEKAGIEDVGRVLPADYLFFSQKGLGNKFRNAYKGGQYWDWTLPSPYED